MASHEIVDDIVSIRNCFIWSRHTAINNLELTILDQSSDLGPLNVVLTIPPHFEELNFCIWKSSIWVTGKLLHDSCKNAIDWANVKLKILTLEVILNSALPAEVSVRVWNDMHVFCSVLSIEWVQRLLINITKQRVVSFLSDVI